MLGRESLELVIVVRIHVPEPRGAPRLVLGMLLQSIAARFDSEAPYRSPTSGEEPGLINLADGFDTRAADVYSPHRDVGRGRA